RAEAAGDEERGEAHGGAERLDHQRGREGRRDLEHAQEEPGLEGTHEPAEQVEADREREPPPLTAVEGLEGTVEILRRRERLELLEPSDEPGAATHAPGELHRQE